MGNNSLVLGDKAMKKRHNLTRHLISVALGFIGFIAQVAMQASNNKSFLTVLGELKLNNDSNESITRIINQLNNPLSIMSIVWFIIFFAFGEIMTYIFSKEKDQTPPCDQSLTTTFSDDFAAVLVSHIRKSIYSKCSGISDSCKDCPNMIECDGLIRNYLYNETEHLENSINDAREGKYKLDTNITQFHTLAIQHLMQINSPYYSVIQWIGNSRYSENNRYQETFDNLDFDFLQRLITEVLKSIDTNTSTEFCLKQKQDEKRFSITWVLVGDKECMKNNYDYVFYVMKHLENMYGKYYYDALKHVFRFYCISEEKYKIQIDQLLVSEQSNLVKEMFCLDSQTLRPSFGLFGTRFMFVDGLTTESHGTIYTIKYRENDVCPVERANNLYKQILSEAESIPFDVLKHQFDTILAKDPDWTNMLKEIWERK